MVPEDKPEQATEHNAQANGAEHLAETIGARLRFAREKAGLSIQDVAERTRVPARHLLSIDEDRYHDLPALAYSAGFARAYAQAVGLDGAAIAAQFRAEANPDPVPYYDAYEPVDPARVPSKLLAWAGAVVGLAIIASLLIFGTGLFRTQQTAGEIVLAEVEHQQQEEANAAESALAQSSAEAADNQDNNGALNANTLAAGASALPGEDGVQSGSGQVVLKASEDAWIKVYDKSGQTVRMGILAAGESYPVPGDPNQLLLWTGKAGAVQVSVNGKPIAPLGKLVQTVRDVSLAPQSLLARNTPPQSAAAPR